MYVFFSCFDFKKRILVYVLFDFSHIHIRWLGSICILMCYGVSFVPDYTSAHFSMLLEMHIWMDCRFCSLNNATIIVPYLPCVVYEQKLFLPVN